MRAFDVGDGLPSAELQRAACSPPDVARPTAGCGFPRREAWRWSIPAGWMRGLCRLSVVITALESDVGSLRAGIALVRLSKGSRSLTVYYSSPTFDDTGGRQFLLPA